MPATIINTTPKQSVSSGTNVGGKHISGGKVLARQHPDIRGKNIGKKIVGDASIKRKKKRAKPGTKALKEIKKQQAAIVSPVALAPIRREMLKAMSEHQSMHSNIHRIQSDAVRYVREVVDGVVLQMHEQALKLALHAKRQTVMEKDIRLSIRIENDHKDRVAH